MPELPLPLFEELPLLPLPLLAVLGATPATVVVVVGARVVTVVDEVVVGAIVVDVLPQSLRATEETVRDTLAWDRSRARTPMAAGLSPERERSLLAAWRARGG